LTAFKSLLFFLFVPLLLICVVPYRISMTDVPVFDLGALRYLAFACWAAGAAMIVWCFWDFTFKGRGTPAPFDPPRELVVSGLYRHVRNPIYLGGLLVLMGWALWSSSFALLLTPLIFLAVAHLFVVGYEEPNLRGRFGESYVAYCLSVPRWIPRLVSHEKAPR
jgi:protein-S-isoprenylcysteine O-methyltransferase Ste14